MSLERTFWQKPFLSAGIVGIAAFSISTQPAAGFFPPVTNGTNKVTVVPPVVPPIVVPPVVPPVVNPPFKPPVVVVPPVVPPPVINPPNSVPEPATLVTAGIGLAVVGLMRRKKAKQKSE